MHNCERCNGSGDVLAGTTSERECPECKGTGTKLSDERSALIALVQHLGEAGVKLPVQLHAEIREVLGDDFYAVVAR